MIENRIQVRGLTAARTLKPASGGLTRQGKGALRASTVFTGRHTAAACTRGAKPPRPSGRASPCATCRRTTFCCPSRPRRGFPERKATAGVLIELPVFTSTATPVFCPWRSFLDRMAIFPSVRSRSRVLGLPTRSPCRGRPSVQKT